MTTFHTLLKHGARIVALFAIAWCAGARGDETAQPQTASPQQLERRAMRMVANAVELINGDDAARGEGILEAVPGMFPGTQAVFKARLELARRRIAQQRHDDAVALLRFVDDADNADMRAEALMLRAAALRARNRPGEAVTLLRRVTQEFPDSPFADDAYFEIGQAHFDGARWTKALEAFKRVGTMPPARRGASASAPVYAEAGQRLFAQVSDRDLDILRGLGETVRVTFSARSGDVETVDLVFFGQDGSEAFASVETVSEATEKEDGRLTVHGGDTVTVDYADKTDAAGNANVLRRATVDVVSTGLPAFTDGSGLRNVSGVFAGQPAFLRLRDLDLDTTPAPDSATVTLTATYLKTPTEDEPDIAPDTRVERARIAVTLTETAARSGIFEGRIQPVLIDTNAPPPSGPNIIGVMPGDTLEIAYTDVRHIDGLAPVVRTANAVVLTGGNPEPQSIMAASNDPDVQSRKLLLEARLLHKLGSIFKDVGLDEHAAAKAAEGLRLVADIMDIAARSNLERATVEQAFVAKWELLLLQDKLGAAIDTCRALVRLYPDTIYADLALMRIAAARVESNNPRDIASGIDVYRSVLRQPDSASKPEALFRIALAHEKLAKLRAGNRAPDMTETMKTFRACVETYPDSSFAGESFKRIVEHYVAARDYARALETLDRVFADYPDAPWLDDMLVQWGIVLYRRGDRAGAASKFRRVLEEYPGGKAATTAAELLKRVQ